MNELYHQARGSSLDRDALLHLLLRKEGIDRAPAQLARRAAGEHNVPASFAQQRLLILDQLEPGNPAYIIPFELRLSGVLNHAAVEAALRAVVRRHEVLRTVYAFK